MFQSCIPIIGRRSADYDHQDDDVVSNNNSNSSSSSILKLNTVTKSGQLQLQYHYFCDKAIMVEQELRDSSTSTSTSTSTSGGRGRGRGRVVYNVLINEEETMEKNSGPDDSTSLSKVLLLLHEQTNKQTQTDTSPLYLAAKKTKCMMQLVYSTVLKVLLATYTSLYCTTCIAWW